MLASTIVGERCVHAVRAAEQAWVRESERFSPQSAVAIGLGFLGADPITARIYQLEELILKRRRNLWRFLSFIQDEIQIGNLVYFLREDQIAVLRLDEPRACEAWRGDVDDEDDGRECVGI